MTDYHRAVDLAQLWHTIRAEATRDAGQFPLLSDFYRRNILQFFPFFRPAFAGTSLGFGPNT